MQVHVAQQDADRTTLWGSLFVWIDLTVFQDACLQPAPDQADHARIADAVLHEAEHPFVAETPERSGDRLPIHRDFPDSVIVTREGQPLEGRALAVIGSICRRGILFALACLPDGSRALIPAQWTDWDECHCGSVRACREANVGSRSLGSLSDLLQLRHLVDALRGRSIAVGLATEGERRATEPGLFRPTRSIGGPSFGEPRTEPLGTARRARAAGRTRDPGAPDCPHVGGSS